MLSGCFTPQTCTIQTVTDCLVAKNWQGQINTMAKTTRNTLNQLKHCHTHAIHKNSIRAWSPISLSPHTFFPYGLCCTNGSALTSIYYCDSSIVTSFIQKKHFLLNQKCKLELVLTTVILLQVFPLSKLHYISEEVGQDIGATKICIFLMHLMQSQRYLDKNWQLHYRILHLLWGMKEKEVKIHRISDWFAWS